MTFVPEALKPELLVRLLSDPLGQGATSPWIQRYLIVMTGGTFFPYFFFNI
jgi:hypothetical protein